jgi:hypothetical protein
LHLARQSDPRRGFAIFAKFAEFETAFRTFVTARELADQNAKWLALFARFAQLGTGLSRRS